MLIWVRYGVNMQYAADTPNGKWNKRKEKVKLSLWKVSIATKYAFNHDIILIRKNEMLKIPSIHE